MPEHKEKKKKKNAIHQNDRYFLVGFQFPDILPSGCRFASAEIPVFFLLDSNLASPLGSALIPKK